MNPQPTPQPREYSVLSFDPWIDKATGQPIKDGFGNVKGTVLFNEDRAEPIDGTFKTIPNVGDKKFGVVDFYTTKAGSLRKGFKRAERPEQASGYGGVAVGSSGSKPSYQSPEQQESIARSVALKASVDLAASIESKYKKVDDVLATADIFLAWLQNKPSASVSTDSTVVSQPTNEPQRAVVGASSQPARNWNSVGQRDRDPDPEAQSLYNRQAEAEFYPDDVPPDGY